MFVSQPSKSGHHRVALVSLLSLINLVFIPSFLMTCSRVNVFGTRGRACECGRLLAVGQLYLDADPDLA